ncbi:hypothetical protein Tco_0052045 [Tanacetum coccineum]
MLLGEPIRSVKQAPRSIPHKNLTNRFQEVLYTQCDDSLEMVAERDFVNKSAPRSTRVRARPCISKLVQDGKRISERAALSTSIAPGLESPLSSTVMRADDEDLYHVQSHPLLSTEEPVTLPNYGVMSIWTQLRHESDEYIQS